MKIKTSLAKITIGNMSFKMALSKAMQNIVSLYLVAKEINE